MPGSFKNALRSLRRRIPIIRPRFTGTNLNVRLAKDLVVFCIPLKARASSRDWSLVCANLVVTLRSIRNSADKNYHVVVVGHDYAEGLDGDDVTFVRVDTEVPGETIEARREDKFSKRYAGAAWIGRQAQGSVWIMHLDADDLVSKRLVDAVRHFDGGAILIDKGYRFYLNTGELQYFDSNFQKYCGSTFVGHFTRDSLPLTAKEKGKPVGKFTAHPRAFEIADKLGMRPGTLSFPGSVYVINHGESLQTDKRGTRRSSAFSAPIVDEAEALQMLANEFGFADSRGPFSLQP